MTPNIKSWIFGWGEYIKVIKPQSLIDEIKNKLKVMGEMYEK